MLLLFQQDKMLIDLNAEVGWEKSVEEVLLTLDSCSYASFWGQSERTTFCSSFKVASYVTCGVTHASEFGWNYFAMFIIS